MERHDERAYELFLSGCNCAQAVLLAFAPDAGLTEQQALRVASSFGGGIGGMREVCGAVSGAVLVYSQLRGYTDPEDQIAKTHHYARVQQLCLAFQEKWDTIVCRNLLAGLDAAKDTSPVPDARTPEYYKTRPCVRFVETAAQLLEDMLV